VLTVGLLTRSELQLRVDMKDLIAPGITFATGLAILALIPSQVPDTGGSGIGSRTLPYVLAIVIAVAGLFELVRLGYNQFSKNPVHGAGSDERASHAPAPLTVRERIMQVLIIGLTIFWAYSLDSLGHFVVSSILTALVAIAFGLRRPIPLLSTQQLWSSSLTIYFQFF